MITLRNANLILQDAWTDDITGNLAQTLEDASIASAGTVETGSSSEPEFDIETAFTLTDEPDYHDPQPANLIAGTEDFATEHSPTQFTRYSENTQGTLTIEEGLAKIIHDSGAARNDIVTLTGTEYDMPDAFISIEIPAIPSGSTGYDNGGVGLVKDEDNFIFANVDRVAGQARIQIKIGGSNHFMSVVSGQTWLSAPFKLALSLVGNSACLYKDVGGVWTYVTGATVGAYYDFRTLGNLAGWQVGFTLATADDAEWHFDNLKYGSFGGVGIRDMSIVTNPDGTPYLFETSKTYFTATLPDGRGVAHTGVFSFDLSDYTFEQVSAIMISRNGKIYADLAAHIILDGNNSRLTISTWGNGFGSTLDVLYKFIPSHAILSGANVIADLATLALPNVPGGGGSYDSFLVYDRINKRWLLAYVITDDTDFVDHPFYAAAAYSTDFITWTAIGADSGNNGYEGAKILPSGDTFVICVGGPAGDSDSSRVYNAAMEYLGPLDAIFDGLTYTQPHPMLFRYGSKYIILTFDHTQMAYGAEWTHGQPKIYEGEVPAAPELSGIVADTLSVIQESIAATLQSHLIVSISDTLQVITDAFEPPPVEAAELVGAIADTLGIPYDEALAFITDHLDGSVGDSLSVIQDQIAAILIDMTAGSQRWVAPVSITPVTSALSPLYLAAHPVRHPDWYFEPRVKSYGLFTRAISAPVGFVQTGDGNLTVLDPDNSVRRRIATRSVMRAATEIKLGPEGGSYASFLRPLSRQIGIVGQPADGELSFPLIDNISSYLEQSIPGLIDLANFPNLPEASAGEFAPIIFGHVSCRTEKVSVPSEGNAWGRTIYQLMAKLYSDIDGGAIRAIHVDSTAHKYLIARHPCREVEVWRKEIGEDSFSPVATSGYTRLNETLASGHTCELIQFDADQEGAEIRVNVDGVFDDTRYTFVGFYGKYASDYLTHIGLIARDTFVGENVFSELAGSNDDSGLTSFEDTDIPADSRISAIKVWEGASYHIYAIQLEYTDADGIVTEGTKHGVTGGDLSRFEILQDEYITEISGHTGEHVDELVITSNLVSIAYGAEAGHDDYRLFVNQSTGVNFADVILELLTGYIGITKSIDRINLSSFEQTRERVQELVCSGAFTNQITYGEAISQVQRSSNIDLFADKNDKLTVHYTTDDDASVANLSDLLRLYKGSVRQQLAGPVYNQIPYRFAPNYANDKWSEDVYDNEGDEAAIGTVLAEEPLQLYFVRDDATAETVVEKRAGYLTLDCFRFEGEIPLIPSLETLELAELVDIDHFGGFKEGGYVAEQFKILELSTDIDNLKYQFKGIRRPVPPPEEEYGTLSGRRRENSRTGPFYNDVPGEMFGVFLHPSSLFILQAHRTTDYGATWAESDAANHPILEVGMTQTVTSSTTSFDCVAIDNLIHVATQEADGRVRYHCYDMTSHSWVTTNEPVVEALVNKSGSLCVSIEPVYPAGNLFIYFQGERQQVSGSWYGRGYYTKKTAGTWSSPVLATPDPGQYPENLYWPPGYYPAHLPSSNCVVERAISGRDGRMHFFYSVDPGLQFSIGSPDLYCQTMHGDGTLSGRILLYVTSSIDYGSRRNLGGFCHNADRSVIYVLRKLTWSKAHVEVCSEGTSISHSGWWYFDNGYHNHMGETDNPNGSLYLDAASVVHCVLRTSSKQYNQIFSGGSGVQVVTGLQAGPLDPIYPYLNMSLNGRIVTVRGREYLAYFEGYDGAVTKFRWMQINKLPYAWN